ncbi:MAG: calcium/sodium antiporter [Clostridia bacterium]|nr:calcium/sodium antiporter [Clostridia bacterium]
MVKPILLFILGLVLLIKGGDWFVDGAVGVARRFRLPEILIGATVVSIGTTLPEVMVSATSAVQGQSEMSYGNAVGSIICNAALIAAVTIAVRPGAVNRRSMKLPVVFFFLSAVLYCAVSYFAGTFARPVGIVLLAIFLVYMILSVREAKRNPLPALAEGQAPEEPMEFSSEAAAVGSDVPEEQPETDAPDPSAEKKKARLALLKDLAFLIVGAALIAVGARLLVDNGTELAQKMGVPSTVIALTFVALGTSLPELITAITSLIKGHSALSIGNIIGANLFNLVLVCGLSITLRPFDVPATSFIGGVNTSLVIDLPLMACVMLILTVPALLRGKLARWQGILLLCLYAGFCVFQFVI